ncbi:hypothetical protein ACFSLT_09745 [Novosphingobium resinovorum]
MRFECAEPFRRWTAAFDGPVARTSAQEILDNPDFAETAWSKVAFTVDMEMAAIPWEPGTILPEAAEALGGKQGDYMSPRYEQLFRCSGTLVIDGEERAFRGNGLRIRRTGFRAFAGFWGTAGSPPCSRTAAPSASIPTLCARASRRATRKAGSSRTGCAPARGRW